MMTITRINKMGITYHLTNMGDGQTMISNGVHSIIVPAHIDRVSQSWYSWQMNGAYIQTAFSYLNAGQREFIMTGINDVQWNQIFGTKEE
jgi:hypothetical protein